MTVYWRYIIMDDYYGVVVWPIVTLVATIFIYDSVVGLNIA